MTTEQPLTGFATMIPTTTEASGLAEFVARLCSAQPTGPDLDALRLASESQSARTIPVVEIRETNRSFPLGN